MPFSTREVSRLTGASLRQLQWWDENSIVRPERGRHGRSYTQPQVLKVLVLQRLRGRGMKLGLLRAMLPNLQALCREASSRINAGLRGPILVISAKGKAMRVSDQVEACRIMESMTEFATIVDLDREARLLPKGNGNYIREYS